MSRGASAAIGFLQEMIRNAHSPMDPAAAPEQTVAGLQRVLQVLTDLKDFDFREIGEYVHDGIYIADGEGKTLYVNKAYTRMTGIQPDEVVDKTVEELEQQGLFKNAVTPQVLKNKTQVSSMGKSLRNGTEMLITGNPVFDEQGQITKVVNNNRVITDLLKMQTELEASQALIRAVEQDRKKSEQEIELLRRQQSEKNLIGSSEETRHLIKQIEQVAKLDVTVLITGETGSGKEVVANELYVRSDRGKGPFIKVNCAAIPANLLEAELFGYEKGAFTGATAAGKLGMFDLAQNGTLLLDEIGDMPLELQSKLLRVIQHKEVTRIGGAKPIKLDVRIISSTNCDLKEQVRTGKFREDLYYRLNVFPINIPPLRQRGVDIEDLTRHFLSIYNAKYAKNTLLEEAGVLVLKHYSWPGNIRELQNIIERLVIISEPAAAIDADLIGSLLNVDTQYSEVLTGERGLKELVENLERKTIAKVLAACGSTRKAAKILKIDQSTIVKKAKKLGINLTDDK
ncbi:MAG TPA: sigma 54-interacting transcriptional regulator [Patescibacteria group bacterium]|nr:sigma 54-interacting transcriptional regulator [Patescibacteria group bacterium]